MNNLRNKWAMHFEGIPKGEIKKKKLIKKDFKSIEEIVETVSGIKQNEYIYIQKGVNILPRVSDGTIVSGNWFWKRGKTANVPYITAGKCKKDRINPQEEVIKTLEKISNSKYKDFNRRGISWTGIIDKRKRIIPLIYLVLGYKLYALMEQEEIKPRVRGYGNQARVEGIISRYDPNEQRDIDLRSLPVTKNDGEYFAEVWNLESHSTSPGWSFRTIDHKYKPKEIVFGPEEIAAYIFRSTTEKIYRKKRDKSYRKITIEEKPEPIMLNPFLIPSPLLVEFNHKLSNNVIVYHEIIKDYGRKEDSDKKLIYSQRNCLLFHAAGIKKPRSCFIVSENLNKQVIKFIKSYINKIE